MNRNNLTLFCLGFFFSHVIMADQSDYQNQMSLKLKEGHAAFVFDIPEDVYRTVAYPYLSDVRIVNTTGDFVPMRIVLNSDEIKLQYTQTSLPTFKLNKTTSLPINTKQVRTTRSGNYEDYTVETSKSMRHFIQNQENIDNSKIYIDASVLKDQKIEKFSLDWHFENQGNRLFYVKLSGSNDLSNWQTVKARQKLLEIKSGNKIILENAIDLNHKKYLYYQLVFENNIRPEIKSIHAHFITHKTKGQNHWNVSENIEFLDDNAIIFDSKGYFPIESFKIDFNQKNILTSVSIYSRNSHKSKWHYAGSGNIYSILIDGQVNDKNLINIRRSTNRYWKVVFDDHINNTSVKSVKFSWRNHQIEFLAQGEGPFSIYYGNKSQKHLAPNNWFSQLPRNMYFSDDVVINKSNTVVNQVVDHPETIEESDKAKLTFWLILGFVILLLAFMAYKLVGESKEE